MICDSLERKKAIFATARGYGDYKGQWEFPGGKVETGESPRQALVREIEEVLETKILVGDLIDRIDRIEWDYSVFHLSMDCFWCEILEGNLTLLEAEAARWLTRDELYSVPFLPADKMLIEKVAAQMF